MASLEELKGYLWDAFDDYGRVSRVPVLDKMPTAIEFRRKYVYRSTPVIIKNGWNSTLTTAAVKPDLSLQHLRQNGNFPVQVSATPNGLADAATTCRGNTIFAVPEEREMTLKGLCEHLDAQNDDSDEICYYQKQCSNLTEECSELMNHLIPSSVGLADEAFGRDKLDAINLWLGSSQSTTSMHKDPYENIYFVVEGKKTFRMHLR